MDIEKIDRDGPECVDVEIVDGGSANIDGIVDDDTEWRHSIGVKCSGDSE